MTAPLRISLAFCILLCHGVVFTFAVEKESDKAQTYSLRYRFSPQETVCWKVVHRGKISATISGSTENTEMSSESLKLWRVVEVKPDGVTTFEYRVENVKMRQKLTGKKEVRYNSQTDKKSPPGFEDVAKAVGKRLTKITIDARGEVIERKKMIESPFSENKGQLTIPLPEKPVAVGETWSQPHEVVVPIESGGIKRVQTVQKYTLKSVKTGVATILVETQILTPISHPAIEAKLIQQASRGTVRFDVDAGRILSQKTDLDRRVVGFRGAASSLHYLTLFTEKLLDAPLTTAGRSDKDTRK